MNRSTEEVLDDHLRLRIAGDVESDLARNYADDVVLLCEFGVLEGHAAIRKSARKLGLQLPNAEFELTSKVCKGEFAQLLWKARSDRFEVDDGADSFVIRGGWIVAQTIFYHLVRGSLE